MRKFEWSLDKNRANLRKHGVSFEEARELFAPGTPRERALFWKRWGERGDD